MKITGVEIAVADPVGNDGLADRVSLRPANVIVRMRTDEGIDGIGAATATFGGRAVGAAIADLSALVIGQDPLYRERIWQRLMEVSISLVPPQAIAALDCALWDLAGKSVGLPVYQLLGAFRDRVPCYASTLTYESIDDYLRVIDICMARGFRAVKLHGWGDPRRDMALCRAVRKHAGPEIALMLDALGAYDVPEAMRVGRTLDELGFEWFEMPIRDQNMAGYQQLTAALDVAITSGEVHTHGFYDASNYLAMSSWDFIRIDATISGGITGAKKAAALAESFGARCELHSFGYTLALAANLQVVGAIANCTYLEVPLPLGVYDGGMVAPIHIDDGGDAHLPEAPGLGVTVDWKRMDELVFARY